MMHIYYLFAYFFVYGFLGWCVEVSYATTKEREFVNRGFLNGPICPIYGLGVAIVVELLMKYRSNLLLLYVASVILVSALEWVTGFLLEKIFHNKWWDYSAMPLNLNGYICVPFSLVWGVACVLIVDFIHPLIHKVISWVPLILGVVILIVFVIVILTDCIVTAAGIFKMNHALEHMSYITNQLHDISDQIGEEIYKKTIEAMDHQEATRQKMNQASINMKEKQQELSEDMRKQISELRILRDDIVSKMMMENHTSRRLMKAFPKMKVIQKPKLLGEMKERFEQLKKWKSEK